MSVFRFHLADNTQKLSRLKQVLRWSWEEEYLVLSLGVWYLTQDDWLLSFWVDWVALHLYSDADWTQKAADTCLMIDLCSEMLLSYK